MSKIEDLLADFPVLVDLVLVLKNRAKSSTFNEFERKKAELQLKSLRMLANRTLKAELALEGLRSSHTQEKKKPSSEAA